MPVLDLTSAEVPSFDPIPSGQYVAEVFEAKMEEVKNEGGKLPKGTPQVNIQFRVLGRVGEEIGEDAEFYNRRVFTRYTLSIPKGYDAKKGKQMLGFFVAFLKAVGYEEEQITKKDFDLDLEDLKQRQCRITVGINPGSEQYEPQNIVKAVRPVGEPVAVGGLLT